MDYACQIVSSCACVGAGGAATASAVLADVVALANRPLEPLPSRRFGNEHVEQIVPIGEVRSAHYVRIPTRDEPGVFAQVANALSRHEISIEAAIQKEPHATQDLVAIVILTHVAKEADIVAALDEVSKLPQVTDSIARIRVETLD